MNTNKTETPPTDFWDSVRGSLVNGIKDLRDRGDDLARQGRLRMDLVQAQRRLRRAFETIGEACFDTLKSKQTIEPKDSRFIELCERIHYYTDEINRLQEELKKQPLQPD